MNSIGKHAAAKRLFVALDFPNAADAIAMAEELAPLRVGLKVGLELYTAEGPSLLSTLSRVAPDSAVFLDLKFHDIPATVAGAVRSATRLNVSLMNLHMSGGEGMVRAAVTARDEISSGGDAPRLIGVTVLTSLDAGDLRAVWGDEFAGDPGNSALHLAMRAAEWGLDGVVASAREAAAIRAACGEDFLIVTPGIRPAGAAMDDQKRVLSPAEALSAGASHLVVGRPVRQAAAPAEACRGILADMSGVLG